MERIIFNANNFLRKSQHASRVRSQVLAEAAQPDLFMKTYDKYKPSGIDWIGDIPEHWKIKKLKYLVELPNEIIAETSFLIAVENIESKTGKIINLDGDKTYQGIINEFLKGDVLFNKLRPYLAKVYFAEQNGGYVGELLNFRSSEKLHDKFLYYRVASANFIDIVDSSTTGTKMPRASWEDFISHLLIAFPPTLDEQSAIANYLDEKTAQIDLLINQKLRLIELLKEERTAIINQAVTRGINPTAKLKPSGITWLGDIPAHWGIKRLKFITKIKYGLGQPPNQKDDGLPLIRATNIERGRIVEKDLLLVDPDDIPYDRDPILKENDIIVVRSGAYTADSAIIPKRFEGAIAGYDMVLRVYIDSPLFISFCLLSNYVLINQLYLERLRAAQPHLNKEELGETLIMLPPIEEQKQIVAFIETATAKIDATVAKIEREIELVQEYRTALISEIVTGKISVV